MEHFSVSLLAKLKCHPAFLHAGADQASRRNAVVSSLVQRGIYTCISEVASSILAACHCEVRRCIQPVFGEGMYKNNWMQKSGIWSSWGGGSLVAIGGCTRAPPTSLWYPACLRKLPAGVALSQDGKCYSCRCVFTVTAWIRS